MLLNKKDNTYNVDKMFDYSAIKAMVIESLEKIVRQELNQHIVSINLHKIGTHEDKEDIVISSSGSNLFNSQDDDNNKLAASLLKLKIRNTTEYLNWRLAILKCDNSIAGCVVQVSKTTRH